MAEKEKKTGHWKTEAVANAIRIGVGAETFTLRNASEQEFRREIAFGLRKLAEAWWQIAQAVEIEPMWEVLARMDGLESVQRQVLADFAKHTRRPQRG